MPRKKDADAASVRVVDSSLPFGSMTCPVLLTSYACNPLSVRLYFTTSVCLYAQVGLIVGLTIGSVLCCGLCIFIMKRRKSHDDENGDSTGIEMERGNNPPKLVTGLSEIELSEFLKSRKTSIEFLAEAANKKAEEQSRQAQL